MATAQKLLHIEEIQGPLAVPGGATPQRRTAGAVRTLQLNEITRQVGTVLVPTYIPAGFSLIETSVGPTDMVRLEYAKGIQHVSLRQSATPAYPQVGKGYLRPVAREDLEAYMVQGGWVSVHGDPIEWSSSFGTGLLWEQSGRWFELRAVPAMDESELLGIAQSLQAYQG